jgi:hypothetical protein
MWKKIKMKIHLKTGELGVVAYGFNPTYSGGGDWGDHGLRQV